MSEKYIRLLLKDLTARLSYGVKGRILVDYVVPHRYDIEGFPVESTFDAIVELCGINTDTEEISVKGPEDNEELADYIEECQSDEPWTILDFKPFLRPMSSMTAEEKAEINAIISEFGDKWLDSEDNKDKWSATFWQCSEITDYLNSIHIDHRGLIGKGLAIEVVEENNPYI